MSANADQIDLLSSKAADQQQSAGQRKSYKDARSRLLSDSTDEAPRGILKRGRLPTKRSASECIDDLNQIMAELNFEMPLARRCPVHQSYFDEHDEVGTETEDDDDDEDDEHEDSQEEDEEEDLLARFYDWVENKPSLSVSQTSGDDHTNVGKKSNFERKNTGYRPEKRATKKCDCIMRFSGDNQAAARHRESSEKPKKSVRFDDVVRETFYYAARLYDRRNFVKYHSSTRHHPPVNQQKHNSKSKNKRDNSKSSGKLDHADTNNPSKQTCRQTKSQRAKQSKKDKRASKLKKLEESCEDQGYSSSVDTLIVDLKDTRAYLN